MHRFNLLFDYDEIENVVEDRYDAKRKTACIIWFISIVILLLVLILS